MIRSHIKERKASFLQGGFPSRTFLVGTALSLLLSCGSKKADRPEITFAAALLPSEQLKYVQILEGPTEKTGIALKLIPQQYAQIRSAIEAESKAGRGELDIAELDVYLLPIMKPYMQSLDPLLENREDLSTQWDAFTYALLIQLTHRTMPPLIYYYTEFGQLGSASTPTALIPIPAVFVIASL